MWGDCTSLAKLRQFLSYLTPPEHMPEWFEQVPWLTAFLIFVVVLEIFDQYLNFRQLRTFSDATPPHELQDRVTEEHLKKANAYNKDKLQFEMMCATWSLANLLFTMIFGIYPQIWTWSGRVVGTSSEFLRVVVFFALQMPLSYLRSIPTQLYRDFVIEERHGFNKKTIRLFLMDEVKELLLTGAIGMPILGALLWVVRVAGKSFFFWLWAFLVVTLLVMTMIYPNFIAPLFNKFEPLKDEELMKKIHGLASDLSFPLTSIFQMDGSTRSAHSNAYMYGFWRNKRVVLYDTLLELPHEQILAILGHELGHWKFGHTQKNLVISFFQMLVMLWASEVIVWNTHLYQSFGFSVDAKDMSIIIGLFIFQLLYSPISVVTGLLMTLMSRRFEFQADAFAVKLGLGDDLQRGLFALFEQNLSSLHPDPWYAWYHFSHPPLMERVGAIRDLASKDK